MTSAIFEATISCEFITPFFPNHFLVLASVANLGKAIALAAFVATAPAFQQALCRGGNLADITAKNQVGCYGGVKIVLNTNFHKRLTSPPRTRWGARGYESSLEHEISSTHDMTAKNQAGC